MRITDLVQHCVRGDMAFQLNLVASTWLGFTKQSRENSYHVGGRMQSYYPARTSAILAFYRGDKNILTYLPSKILFLSHKITINSLQTFIISL